MRSGRASLGFKNLIILITQFQDVWVYFFRTGLFVYNSFFLVLASAFSKYFFNF